MPEITPAVAAVLRLERAYLDSTTEIDDEIDALENARLDALEALEPNDRAVWDSLEPGDYL